MTSGYAAGVGQLEVLGEVGDVLFALVERVFAYAHLEQLALGLEAP